MFLAGPGRGEGIAIALPGPTHGWIFVDGCKVDAGRRAPAEQTFPLHALWHRYRLPDEPTLGIVLTHPHDDHYDGMIDLIEASDPGWIRADAGSANVAVRPANVAVHDTGSFRPERAETSAGCVGAPYERGSPSDPFFRNRGRGAP